MALDLDSVIEALGDGKTVRQYAGRSGSEWPDRARTPLADIGPGNGARHTRDLGIASGSTLAQ
jgi:hypothetical protein